MMEKLKVLVVEDNKRIQAIYRFGLTDGVFEKYFVEDGDEALGVHSLWSPDIIVLDIMLPGVSGYQVLKQIREERQDQRVAVIMASSLADKEAVLDCLKLGIQGYLVKPFTHKDVAGKILDYYEKMNPERAEAARAEIEKTRQGSATA